ncbi:putative tetratricopeptide-like helical domain superfamily [Dioscorea sansibarensis]
MRRRLTRLAFRRALNDDRHGGLDHDLLRRLNKSLYELIRSGQLREAQRVFDTLPQRNVVSWNSMIGGYVRQRELAQARKLFDQMPERDVVSWNSMLAGYASSREPRELEEGRLLFEMMREKDTVSWNTMINGLARNGRMDEALRLFERMPEKNVVSWNTMITGFLGVGDVSNAMNLFERMPVRDAASLSALVSGLIRNGKLIEAENILLKSESTRDIKGAVDAYNTLIAGYGQCGKIEDARRLFDMIPDKNHAFKRNVISWNSMIMCYVKAGDVCSARILFDEMPERDIVSWNTMIAGYVQALEMDEAVNLFLELPEPDALSWNSIVCGFTQKGDVVQARWYFERMPQKNLVSWNTMIAGYEQNGDSDRAIKLFAQMQAAGEKPDRHTFSSVLSACAGLATLYQGVQIHQLIIKTIVADIPINNALITMYARGGNLTEAKAVFNEMKLRKDVISWNAIIGGYAQHGHAKDALAIFAEMKRTKVKPTHITFISVLNACGHAGLVDEGRRYFNSMVNEFGIMPSVEHYASLVDLVGRHGQLDDALDVIKGMLVPPDRAVWGALLGACRVHNNVALAQVAAEALANVEPESSAPYVLMYNMHADEGRWDDALEVREVMDKKRIVKQPGYSWIELQNRVHTFVAGDRSHPLSSEIHSLIDGCNRIIRDFELQP